MESNCYGYNCPGSIRGVVVLWSHTGSPLCVPSEGSFRIVIFWKLNGFMRLSPEPVFVSQAYLGNWSFENNPQENNLKPG